MSDEPVCGECQHPRTDHYANDGCYGGAETNVLCECPDLGYSRWDGLPAEGNLGVVEVDCAGSHDLPAALSVEPDQRMVFLCPSGCKATL